MPSLNPISPKPPIAPAIPLLVGMIAISFAPILVRYSDAPVSVQGMWRMLFTLALMVPFAGGKQLRALRAIKRSDWWLLLAAGFFLALHFLLWMASLSYTSIASSTLILSLEPVFVMIGAYFLFKDRLSGKALGGLAAALIGIAIVGAGDSGLSEAALKGDLLSFLGTAAVAVNMLLAKRILERVPSFLYSLVVFAVTAFCFYLYNVGIGADMTGYPPREWLVFAGLAIVPTVFGHLIFNWLLRYVKPATISMSVLAEPVGASVLGFFLFGEALGAWQLVGGAFVIAGLTLYMRSEAEAYDRPAEPAS